MIVTKTEHQRDFFRVEFPRTYFPIIHLEDGRYDVLDVSECGVRFKIAKDNDFTVNKDLIAIIRFPDGEVFDCSGQVVRADNQAVSLLLSNPLPLKKIRSEHLYLLNHFPTRED